MRFADGWGIVTPTSDHDFAGMCRALDVDGYDDPRVATIGERMTNRELTAEIVARCYAHAESRSMADASARFEAERVPFAMILSPAELPDDPHAVAVGLFELHDHHVVGKTRLAAPSRAVRRDPGVVDRQFPGARRAHRCDPHRARPRRADRRARAAGVVA